MPLQLSQEPVLSLPTFLENQAKSVDDNVFLVVYASHVNGRSWCGDCRRAEPVVEKKFGVEGNKQLAWLVYAGDKLEWKDSENLWKKAPFSVTNLPTLIKVTPEGKWERLVEEDVYEQQKLDSFVGF